MPSDAFIERAEALDAKLRGEPPTMAAAEQHALDLALLSRAAGSSPSSGRLAGLADLIRNEFLACRSPLWELRLPDENTPSTSRFTWLNAHQRELRRGAAEGWTANVVAVEAATAEIDGRLENMTGGRDAEVYLGPPLRAHRDFLQSELLRSARKTPGLIQLPTGRQCFDARSRLLMGDHFDADSTAAAARALLDEPRVFDGVDLRTHPGLHARSELRGIWRPNDAVVRGARLLRHTQQDRRGPAIVAAVAAGALVDLELHRSGIQGATDQLRAELPWIPTTTFDVLVAKSATHPLSWLSTFEGYRELVALRGSMQPETFHRRLVELGALEPQLLRVELTRD